MSRVALRASALTKSYRQGDEHLSILNDLDLEVEVGQRVAILGPSGSGKSTLLHCLAGLDEPDAGSVEVAGEEMIGIGPERQAALRSRCMGFVYQAHHLLPDFSALENVAMPLRIRGDSARAAAARARTLLDEIGLGARARHRPGELSGGERQRVSVARAMAAEPAVILADEPTGNLDRSNAERVFELLLALSRTAGSAVLVVTHDQDLASRMDRQVTLSEGRLQ
ncbi:MAG: ABC transporter ATP-binding protein [Pseudomonadota bacterium]